MAQGAGRVVVAKNATASAFATPAKFRRVEVDRPNVKISIWLRKHPTGVAAEEFSYMERCPIDMTAKNNNQGCFKHYFHDWAKEQHFR